MKNGYFGALMFQEIEFFEHLRYNFKTSWPPTILIFKIEFIAKNTPISTIKTRSKVLWSFENHHKNRHNNLPQKWVTKIHHKKLSQKRRPLISVHRSSARLQADAELKICL